MLFIILLELKSKQNGGVLCAFVLSPPLPFGVLEGTKAKQPNKSGFENLVFLCGNVQFVGGVQPATPEHALFSTD
jgi:hypothetical protein